MSVSIGLNLIAINNTLCSICLNSKLIMFIISSLPWGIHSQVSGIHCADLHSLIVPGSADCQGARRCNSRSYTCTNVAHIDTDAHCLTMWMLNLHFKRSAIKYSPSCPRSKPRSNSDELDYFVTYGAVTPGIAGVVTLHDFTVIRAYQDPSSNSSSSILGSYPKFALMIFLGLL